VRDVNSYFNIEVGLSRWPLGLQALMRVTLHRLNIGVAGSHLTQHEILFFFFKYHVLNVPFQPRSSNGPIFLSSICAK